MKKRIFYGCAIVIGIILIIYSIILLKRGIILTEENPLVQELYQMSHPSKEVMVLNELYQEDGFTNKYILAVGMKEYIKENAKKIILEEDLEQKIYSIFGNIPIKHENFYLLANSICGFEYNKENHTYEQLAGCGGSINESYEQKIIALNKIGNKITMQEKVIFLVQEEEKTYIYTSSNKENLLAKVDNEQYNKEDYIDKGYTYEFTFTSINKNYKLTDLHVIKE